VPEVFVIDADGTQTGVMKIEDALAMAVEADLDLIELSPVANPPVCRIMNMGQWQYIQSQKQKKQKKLDTKVIRLSFKIGEHDRQVRMNQATKFLEKGHRVKLEMRLKGREKAHTGKARELVQKFIKDIDIELLEDQPISMQGMSVNAMISKKTN